MVNATGAPRRCATSRSALRIPGACAASRRTAPARWKLRASMGYRRLAIYARNDPGSREMAKRLQEDAIAAGLQAAARSRSTARARPILGRRSARRAHRRPKPGSRSALPRDAAEMVKSFRKQATRRTLFVAQGAADPQFIRLVGQDAEHALGISSVGARSRHARERAFRGGLRAQVVRGADASRGARLRRGKGARGSRAARRALDQEKLREALQALELETPLGPYKVDKSGAQLAAKPAVVQIQRGRRQVVWPESLATASGSCRILAGTRERFCARRHLMYRTLLFAPGNIRDGSKRPLRWAQTA